MLKESKLLCSDVLVLYRNDRIVRYLRIGITRGAGELPKRTGLFNLFICSRLTTRQSLYALTYSNTFRLLWLLWWIGVGEPCFGTNGPARPEWHYGLTENRRVTKLELCFVTWVRLSDAKLIPFPIITILDSPTILELQSPNSRLHT